MQHQVTWSARFAAIDEPLTWADVGAADLGPYPSKALKARLVAAPMIF
jgi:hypothetical protein